MTPKHAIRFIVVPAVLLFGMGAISVADNDEPKEFQGMLLSRNDSGFAATFNAAGGPIDTNTPFFKSIGANGRTCNSCHKPDQGWTVTPKGIQAVFHATDGLDPIFRLNDGANSPNADVSTTDARRSAYNMLLTKGLIRIGLPIPAGAEFELIAADDPYHFASANELSLFRRPLPTTNVKFLSTVMWDARETARDPASPDCILTPTGVPTTSCFASIHSDLRTQANDATTGHAQSVRDLTSAEREAIARFQENLVTAQVFDFKAKTLTARGAKGGPQNAFAQPFYFGINDVVSGDYRTRAPFNPVVFNLYDAWASVGSDFDEHLDVGSARRAVARGQALFNTKRINIVGVKGLNDDLNIANLAGTCTTCHDTPNAGDHSIPAPLDIGLTDESRRTPDMPLYTLRNKTTGEIVKTTDPGRALLTGKWKDVARFKGPVLRALATRAPYFHNGFAKDIAAAVDFYDTRFGIGFTEQEKHDLIAFLKTL